MVENIDYTIVKEWGFDQLVTKTYGFSVHRCIIKQGGKSSKGEFHKHIKRANLFQLESGILHLFIETKNKPEGTLIVLDESQRQYLVFPGVWHRFEAITDVILYEVYYTSCDIKDTIRRVKEVTNEAS